jgi:HlyD family secretion protein
VAGRLIAFLLLLCAALGAGWWWTHRVPPPVQWQGYADADFVKIGPTQEGLLVAVHVKRGDQVAQGAPLFDQDDANDRAARDQAARQIKQTEAQLGNLEDPSRDAQIKQAEANLADAAAARDKIQSDLVRNEGLLRSGGVSRQFVENQRADLRSAVARVAALDAALTLAREPTGRAGEIRAHEAMVDAGRAGLAMASWRLDQRHVSAPVAGLVADVLAFAGETVTSGAPVISLLPPENIFIRLFVPEGDLARVHPGDEVALICDACPADLKGTISFISPRAEYTPPVIYSEASRAKLVYLVEARPPPAQASLINPGQPVAVRPPARGSP